MDRGVSGQIEAIWEDDRLGYAETAAAFTNLITSFSDHRTISIEAGYGRGKTFFRKRWAEHLGVCGEVVLEIDALRSDHSGDPVVTFLGALLAMVPEKETARRDKVLSTSKKIAAGAAKVVGKAVLREGFAELAEAVEPEDGEVSALQDMAKAAGQDLSKTAGDMIVAQLSAEKAREGLSDQLAALHAEITGGKTDRVIILIDELDRCHPDYAIALLEAMKLVFEQDGFIFVLMVNSEYLESIAAHRFGKLAWGELYLDKFVDLRLRLQSSYAQRAEAAALIVLNMKYQPPFGTDASYSIERAAALVRELATISELSMRQLERLLLKVDVALRAYKDVPLDLPLLIWMVFQPTFSGDALKLDRMRSVKFERKPQSGSDRSIVTTHQDVLSGTWMLMQSDGEHG